MLRSSLVILFLAFSASASAEGFDYNFVFLGYGNADFDDFNADGDGFTLGGSFAINDSLHAFAGYDAVDLSSNGFDIDATRWNAGIGYNTSVADNMDMFARLSYESIDFNPPGPGSVDDSGYGLGVGLRYAASDAVELNAAINYVDYGDLGDDTSLEVGGLYNFTDAFAVGVSAEFSNDVSTFAITGRFYFGQ